MRAQCGTMNVTCHAMAVAGSTVASQPDLRLPRGGNEAFKPFSTGMTPGSGALRAPQ